MYVVGMGLDPSKINKFRNYLIFIRIKESVCKMAKKIFVEYLYLDLNTCDRCIGTDVVLEEVLDAITPTLNLAGYDVELAKIEITSVDLAEQYKFLSSPTIRVNGIDISTTVEENSCGCCSEISNSEVDCRVFEYNGETYEIAPKEMIASLILEKIFGTFSQDCNCTEYELPENLKAFFKGKEGKSKCSCHGGCC